MAISRKATIAGLKAMGWTEDPNPTTRKYEVFVKPDYALTGVGKKMLVGRSGALRLQNEGDTVASSSSLTGGRIHAAICQVGDGGYRFEATAQAQQVYATILKGDKKP